MDQNTFSNSNTTKRCSSRVSVALVFLTLGVAGCSSDGAPNDGALQVHRWSTPTPIAIDSAGAGLNPQLRMTPSGDVIAVWTQFNGTLWNIWANRYVPGAGWETAELIETDDSGRAVFPQVAVDSSGHALAVWQQWDEGGMQEDIWANRYVPGAGWETATLIADSGVAPQIAMDSNGHAVAVWEQVEGLRSDIWANRYVPGTGWGTAELIETNNSGYARLPQIAMDSNGHAVAVWEQFEGLRSDIWANRYVPGTGWETAELIETAPGEASSPQVGVDSTGHAIAVWRHYDEIQFRFNVWANRYVPGTGWETPTRLQTDTARMAANPQVAVGSDGHAVAVWQQEDEPTGNIWASRYIPGTGWETPNLIETDDSGGAGGPQVELSSDGYAFAVWAVSSGLRNNIWANRYVPGTGWETATLIETNPGDSGRPQVAVGSRDYAVAIWAQPNGTRGNVWASRYVP